MNIIVGVIATLAAMASIGLHWWAIIALVRSWPSESDEDRARNGKIFLAIFVVGMASTVLIYQGARKFGVDWSSASPDDPGYRGYANE